MSTARKTAYLALLGNVFIWAAALPIVKPALSYITPYQFLWLRFLVASSFMLPLFAYLLLSQKLKLSDLKIIIPIELLFLAYATLVYLGLEYTSALQASFILNTRPILITFMGIIFLHETEEVHEWIGFILSVIGTLLLIFYPLISGQTSWSDSSTIGNLILFVGVIISTGYAYAVKKYYSSISKLNTQSVNAILGFTVFSILLLATNSLPSPQALSQPSVTLAVFYMGALGTPIALGLLNFGYRIIEASEATLFSYLQPLIYIPLTVIWLGETIAPYQIISLIIIFIGVIIAESRRSTKYKLPTIHHSSH
jgi:drug/metabolite transporter (DMT)-like permease